MTSAPDPVVPDSDPADVRVEYSALASAADTISTLRFQTVALLLVAFGWVVTHDTARSGWLLVAVAAAAEVLDQRSRGVLDCLRRRGKEIESVHWHRTDDVGGFFLDLAQPPAGLWLFSRRVTLPLPGWFVRNVVLHTVVIDALCITAIVYGALLA